MNNLEDVESIERFRSRIGTSESLYKIVDDVFAEKSSLYSESPEKLLEVLKECILPFRKTCKSLNSACDDILNGDLVRMRCMIRESTGYECFPLNELRSAKGEVCCSFLRNSFDSEIVKPTNLKLGTRYNYVVVPVPGASAWYDETFYELAVKEGRSVEHTEVSVDRSNCKIIAKFMDETCSELKPNSVYDLFGIYDTANLTDLELNDGGDSKSLVCHCRSLHVIAYEPVEDHKMLNQELPLMSDTNVDAVSLARESLNLLFGDETSADYMLCHLVSKTYIRWSGKPVCSMPLNLVNVTDSESIIRHIRFLMPKVLVFKVTRDSLCTDNVIPKMNNELGMLEGGVLQLSNGTVLVIDETGFSWASVANVRDEKRAILNKNLRALRTLVKEQVFEYDYTVYNITLECDINVLVLSKEPSCLKLEVPFTLPIPQQFRDGIDPASVLENPELLRECRHALQVCRNFIKDVSIPEDLNKEITDSFVETRSGGVATGPACDQLHRLLTVTRLCAALSYKLESSLQYWRKAKDMEEKRTKALDKFLHNRNK